MQRKQNSCNDPFALTFWEQIFICMVALSVVTVLVMVGWGILKLCGCIS